MKNKSSKVDKKQRVVAVLLALVILGLLSAAAAPYLVRAHRTECPNSCVNNLRELSKAKQEYLKDHPDDPVEFTLEVLCGPGRPLESKPECPAGGRYEPGAVGEEPTCTVGGYHVLP